MKHVEIIVIGLCATAGVLMTAGLVGLIFGGVTLLTAGVLLGFKWGREAL